jgi:hypothetical protein
MSCEGLRGINLGRGLVGTKTNHAHLGNGIARAAVGSGICYRALGCLWKKLREDVLSEKQAYKVARTLLKDYALECITEEVKRRNLPVGRIPDELQLAEIIR